MQKNIFEKDSYFSSLTITQILQYMMKYLCFPKDHYDYLNQTQIAQFFYELAQITLNKQQYNKNIENHKNLQTTTKRVEYPTKRVEQNVSKKYPLMIPLIINLDNLGQQNTKQIQYNKKQIVINLDDEYDNDRLDGINRLKNLQLIDLDQTQVDIKKCVQTSLIYNNIYRLELVLFGTQYFSYQNQFYYNLQQRYPTQYLKKRIIELSYIQLQKVRKILAQIYPNQKNKILSKGSSLSPLYLQSLCKDALRQFINKKQQFICQPQQYTVQSQRMTPKKERQKFIAYKIKLKIMKSYDYEPSIQKYNFKIARSIKRYNQDYFMERAHPILYLQQNNKKYQNQKGQFISQNNYIKVKNSNKVYQQFNQSQNYIQKSSNQLDEQITHQINRKRSQKIGNHSNKISRQTAQWIISLRQLCQEFQTQAAKIKHL